MNHRLWHAVYFRLSEPTTENIAHLVGACHKYLNVQPGILFFAAGPIAEEYARPVNDRDFHVALNLVFVDKTAHDAYQTDATHQQFIAENKASWATVRVFDAFV